MEPQKLRAYLEKVRVQELLLYQNEQTIRYLHQSHKAEPRKKTIQPPPTWQLKKKPVEPERLSKKELNRLLFFSACLPYICIFAVPFFLFYIPHQEKKLFAQYEEELAEYNAQMDEYDLKFKEYTAQKAEIDRQHEQECLQVRQYNTYLDEQIQVHMEKRAQLQQQLHNLYRKGPIHANYRGLIPVTRFCEYLDTGRRTTLSGKGEMYDLYEEELRFQRITDQLDVVNENLRSINVGLTFLGSQLTGIQRNQSMLYEEVARANEEAKKIRDNTERMWQQLEAQNAHLAAISYASETAALHAAETAKETKRIADADELRRHRALLEE